MKGIGSVNSTDVGLVVFLAVLGAFNYGWVFFPAVGKAWTFLNGVLVVGMVGVGLACWVWRRVFAGTAQQKEHRK